MTPEQRLRAADLDARASSLRRAIQDLRARVPPPHVAQRLPHLHAHSIASSAALALQLNAHSSTKEQALQREITIQEENTAYEKAISDCRQRIQEKQMEASMLQSNLKALQREITIQEENTAYEKAISDCRQRIQEKQMEASMLQSNLKEMEIAELDLKAKVDNAVMEQEATQHKASAAASEATGNALLEAESLINVKSRDLEEKKRELKLLEDKVQRLEKVWSLVEEESLKNPSPAQREKVLEKQLHSLIEQLTAKQAQAERLITDIHAKEKDLERLNNIQRNLHSGSSEAGVARNRFSGGLLSGDEDSGAKAVRRTGQSGGVRTEGQKRLMILRSAFVLYILVLHVVVFIKISV